MDTKFHVNYVTTLPKIGNAPTISIVGSTNEIYSVLIYSEYDNNKVYDYKCETNQILYPQLPQYYTPWIVDILNSEGSLVFRDSLTKNIKNGVVFIKIDAYALGDNIAWVAYIEEFRKKHNCKVICSTFFNDLFINAYPELLFVLPDTVIKNVYAQYYIGASNDNNIIYSKILVDECPLQLVASSILGLEHTEIRPKLEEQFKHIKRRIQDKYVCLSEYGSDIKKHWRVEGGWQAVVDKLNSMGYIVAVISKEPTQLQNVLDLTGNHSILDRAVDLMYAEFHLGVSSGLSWLSWAVNTHTLMISDVTPNFHEFQTNITRINANKINKVDYNPILVTSIEKVLTILDQMKQ